MRGVASAVLIEETPIPSPSTATSPLRAPPPPPPPTKPKQKRNKPTLSCLECVERKTKCDRGRPCVACVKRQSHCEYTAVANLIASTDRKTVASKARGGKHHINKSTTSKARRQSVISEAPSNAASSHPPAVVVAPPATDSVSPLQSAHVSGWDRAPRRSAPFALASPLYSNVPYSKSSPSNVFGVGSQHPFSNYWTCQGGLPEVISVMPSKEQADILIAKYFECVDPVYPFLHRRFFYADYERFWALSPDDRNESDASLIALHYAMYALGTQFMEFPSYDERSQTAEFYCSAANQALRLYSYLNRTSMRSVSAMLLMAYFLMNDNHASDAYAWAGIHLRQAYAMRLHRDPDLVVPDASVLEKQARRKLWQAVFHQDTFLTILLKLPPTATHSDVPVESLADRHEFSRDGFDSSSLDPHSRVENLMSISVIAPPHQAPGPLAPPLPPHLVDPAVLQSDVTYLRCMWHLGNLVQRNLSSPVSLALPLCDSPTHKASLVAAFRTLYASFPPHLTTLDPAALGRQAVRYPRAVRQNLFLTSKYFHCLMLLHASENEAGGVRADGRAALEAAHLALWAFFKLWALFENEASVWWVFQHRAFEESLLIAHLLATAPLPSRSSSSDSAPSSSSTSSRGKNGQGDEGERESPTPDPIYVKAKEDISRMLEIMERYGGYLEMHQTRKEVLHEAFGRITF